MTNIRNILVFLFTAVFLTAGGIVEAQDLALYLPFDEGAGNTVNDFSSNANNGLLVGTGTGNWIAGINGLAMDFNGTDGYVEVPDNPSLGIVDKLTIISWFNLDTVKTTGIAVKMPNAPDSGYRLMIEGDYLRGDIFTSVNNTVGSSDKSKITAGNWYLGAMVYDGSSLKLYLNDIEVGSTPAVGNINPNNLPIEIGQLQPGTGFYIDGKVDEVNIYNRDLSKDEIRVTYEDGLRSRLKSNTFSVLGSRVCLGACM